MDSAVFSSIARQPGTFLNAVLAKHPDTRPAIIEGAAATAVALDDTLHDAQPDAAAGKVVARMQPAEGSEQLIRARRVEADAVVLHAHARCVCAFGTQTDTHARAGRAAGLRQRRGRRRRPADLRAGRRRRPRAA